MTATTTYNGFKQVLGTRHLGISGARIFYVVTAGNITTVTILSHNEIKLTISDIVTLATFQSDFPNAIQLGAIG